MTLKRISLGPSSNKNFTENSLRHIEKWSKDLNPFVGAAADADGGVGFVPQPVAGDDVKVLLGDRTWSLVEADQIEDGSIGPEAIDPGTLLQAHYTAPVFATSVSNSALTTVVTSTSFTIDTLNSIYFIKGQIALSAKNIKTTNLKIALFAAVGTGTGDTVVALGTITVKPNKKSLRSLPMPFELYGLASALPSGTCTVKIKAKGITGLTVAGGEARLMTWFPRGA